ncbi:hypothetical protein WJX73_002757 [Symbiochloris irregularis]|uniref:Peptidase M14 domain-containing protein n=1 Tax=Symbiochloris irregularis TaxID=706552 RepID=A0AAW1NYJ2_9CHLO
MGQRPDLQMHTACALCIAVCMDGQPDKQWLEASVEPRLRQPGRVTRPSRDLPKNNTFAKPDYAIYKSMPAVFAELQQLVDQHPRTMQLDVYNRSDEGYSAAMRVVTVEPGGLTSPEQRQNKLRLLLNFGEHGRELVTVEVALRLLRMLGNPAEAVQRSVERGHGPHRLLTLLRHAVFQIVPMENEAGRKVVEAGALCERKNGRGVDTNRNWQVHWGFREKDYDPAEEYPGTRPFSEPEAAILQGLAEQLKPHVWMNAHSGMEALFMPYDHRATIPDGPEAAASLEILKDLNLQSCGGRCAVGSGGKSVGYLAHGTATDYMFEVQKVPLAFTWEIYGDLTAHYNDCFRMFNPLTPSHLQQVASNWSEAIFVLLELMPRHPQVPNVRALSRSRHGHREISEEGGDERVYLHNDIIRRSFLGPPTL